MPQSFTVSGTVSNAGASVSVTLDCGGGGLPVGAPVNFNGTWSCQVSTSAGTGTPCSLTARAVLLSENATDSIGVTIQATRKEDPLE